MIRKLLSYFIKNVFPRFPGRLYNIRFRMGRFWFCKSNLLKLRLGCRSAPLSR
nr:MAG TPA: hypothetical protein [Caudoviricetes sp.]